ncbi:MAG TPA: VTT domain-containing protein [Gammaproteobacteria bacterium]|nr:VTT domain-containing protein [Gammaproteobacteria bacterium]
MSENIGDQEAKTGLTADLLRFCLVGLLFLGLALVIRQGMADDTQQWLVDLRLFLQGSQLDNGLWASSMLFVLITGAAISFGVPRLWVSAAAGAIYGVVLGMTLAMLASMIGAAAVYLMGRRLLGSLVERRFASQLIRWRRRFQQNAFWWVLYARLFPFANATLTSLLCGSCQVPFSLYLSASLIGFIPLTFVFASFGSGGVKGNINQVILGFGLLLLALVARLLFKKLRPKSSPAL